MSKICGNCNHGEYHGYPPLTSDINSVSTIYFWCPIKKHHDSMKQSCEKFVLGESKHFDKFGNVLFIHDWHRPYEDNPYIDVVCASLPPKYEYKCSKCGKVTYTELGQDPEYFGCNC